MSIKRPHKKYYLKDGTRVSSVTTVLGQNLGWGANELLGWARKRALAGEDPNEIRDAAGRFGTIVHAKVEAHEEHRRVKLDGFDPKEVKRADKAYKRYLDWRKEHEVEVTGSELSLVSEKYKFGGTIDLVATIDGRACLPDLKTNSSVRPKMRIQLAAYRQLYFENFGEDRLPIILHVGQGKHPLVPYPLYNTDKEWRVFLLLMELNQLRETLDPFDSEDVLWH
jgi:hypothetical protein